MNVYSSVTTKAVDGVLWRLLQNFSTALVSFIIQIWLARLLLPEYYGVIALTSVFITVSMVFVQTGFTASLIQKPTLSEVEINSVFYSSILFALILYLIIYIIAPFVSGYYSEPILGRVLRIQSLSILIAALYSVPVSLIQRNLEFKKTFVASLVSSIAQGFVGICLALKGYGVWALVYATLTQSILYCMILLIVVKWKPKALFSIRAVMDLFPFSSKILLINLINTLFNNMQSLIIGRAYNAELLGYYNRGYQLPVLIMNNVDGAMNSVTFPVLSIFQNDYQELFQKLRRSLQVSLYFVWPAMVGLIVVSKPLVIVLLTDKWLMSIPFVRLTALICMLWPFSVFSHAINATGRSGLALKLNIFSKGVSLLFMALTYRFGIYVFVGSGFLSSLITTIITILVASQLLGSSFVRIVKDCIPTLAVSVCMGVFVFFVSFFQLPVFFQLLVQVIVGASFYLLVTWVFKFSSLQFVFSYVKNKLTNNSTKN